MTEVVWITGATSGIGEALAHAWAAAGARLVLSARRSHELERVRAALPNADEHLLITLDMTRPEHFDAARQRVEQHFGQLDILINNAGITQRARVMESSIDVDRRIMEVDFFGVIGLTRCLLPWMKQQGRGQLVVISSLVGELPTPKRAAYSAAKHALHGWFEALRAEESHWLDITLAMPGFVQTQVSINALAGDGRPHGQMDAVQANGMSAEQCAKRIFKAVRRRRPQVIIAGPEGAAVYLKRLWPGLYRFVIRRVKVS